MSEFRQPLPCTVWFLGTCCLRLKVFSLYEYQASIRCVSEITTKIETQIITLELCPDLIYNMSPMQGQTLSQKMLQMHVRASQACIGQHVVKILVAAVA